MIRGARVTMVSTASIPGKARTVKGSMRIADIVSAENEIVLTEDEELLEFIKRLSWDRIDALLFGLRDTVGPEGE
jgi:hypothetical protein